MKIITEIELRDRYKSDKFESFVLEKGEKLTPAATQFLTERRIRIEDYNQFRGTAAASKPEHYTHLRGNVLVIKSHPVIKFRGQLDLLEANFIACINRAVSDGYQEMADELNVIFLYLQEIMRAEVLNKPLPFIGFNDWPEAEVRERSHHPEKYFGVGHSTPNPKYGAIYGEVNKLRAMVRQLEIAAVEAFCAEGQDRCERPDIILALNRLSSLVYIIVCKFIGGHYE